METRLNGLGYLPDRHWDCTVDGVWYDGLLMTQYVEHVVWCTARDVRIYKSDDNIKIPYGNIILKARIRSSRKLLRVTAVAAFAAIPIYRESGSTRFSLRYCS